MQKIIMPKLGLTMEEGTVLRWHKAEGETIKEGELLFEVETEKAVNEVEATHSGTLGKILINEGRTVAVLQVIGYILEKGESPPEIWPDLEMLSVAEEESGVAEEPETRLRAKQPVHRGKIIASPRAKRLAQDKRISLEEIQGTGPGGRVMENDVLLYLENRDLITPSRIQAITAERLSLSFNTIPHFYLRIEINASELLALRTKLLPDIERSSEVRLTYTDILLVLLARTLEKHPLLNASWESGKIRGYKEINIGFATATEDGLVVPVIKDTNKKDLTEIARERKALVEKAQAGKLSVSDLEAGTFTLTNLGMFAIDDFDAIINPPQSAILAVGQIAERPFVREGSLLVIPTLRLSLAIDHRVLDGAVAARFLDDLKQVFEAPDVNLMEVSS